MYNPELLKKRFSCCLSVRWENFFFPIDQSWHKVRIVYCLPPSARPRHLRGITKVKILSAYIKLQQRLKKLLKKQLQLLTTYGRFS